MASEPTPWHPSARAVVPYIMSEQTTDRRGSGGAVTKQPVRYAQRTLSVSEMDQVAQEMREWSLRALNPHRKFSETIIEHVDLVVGIWDSNVTPGAALPILEEFLVALRGPYGRGHVTMPVRRNWVESVLDFVYTLVCDDESQELLRDQFNTSV
jgi:hypothetical protein